MTEVNLRWRCPQGISVVTSLSDLVGICKGDRVWIFTYIMQKTKINEKKERKSLKFASVIISH